MSPGRSASVYDRLAMALREMVRSEHLNSGTGAERFRVVSTSPLILAQLAGDVVLEDGDPDFTVGAWMRQYLVQYSLAVGNECWCLREGPEWHLVDVAEPAGIATWDWTD